MQQEKKIPIITFLLILANVLFFAYVELQGSSMDTELMLRMGASFEPYIVEQHEYYRLFTHMFLHFGFEHLFNNMVSLGVLGWVLEEEFGRWKFSLIYFLSGILAGVASLVYNMQIGEVAVSCGASGAIYGLMGAMLIHLILQCRGRVTSVVPRYFLFILLSFYSGMQDTGIDNAAHIGGFVAGFILCILLMQKHKRQTSQDYLF